MSLQGESGGNKVRGVGPGIQARGFTKVAVHQSLGNLELGAFLMVSGPEDTDEK